MTRAVLIAVLCVALLSATDSAWSEQQPPAPPNMAIEDLGDNRYRIGGITIDKENRRFTVPGRIAHLTDPLEYLAVSIGGVKEYESLMELLATPTQIQLASILIGLDDADSVKPRYQFDERPAEGQGIAIEISWQGKEGATNSVAASKALLSDGEPLDGHDWVYIGSVTEDNGQFIAESLGSIVGFVHDPFAIIEHREGLGIGAYGNITGNSSLLPPEGAPVTVSFSVISTKSGEVDAEKIARE